MKPFKAGVSFSKWILRAMVVIFLFASYYERLLYVNFKTIFSLDFLDITFIFAVIYVLAAICLFIGGFRKDSNITVIASLFLLVAIAGNIYFDVKVDGYRGALNHLMPFSVAFYFLSNGNK